MSGGKNIVILSPAHPLRGGIASSTERLAQEWQQQGANVRIYSFRYQYPSVLFPGKTQFAPGEAPPGLDIRAKVHSLNPLNWYRVGRELAKARPDLILVRYWLPFLAPCLGSILQVARKNGHTRIVALVDNLIPHEARPGDRLLTRYFCRAVDGFVVMSKKVGRDVAEMAPGKPSAFVPHPLYDNYGPVVNRQEALRRLQLPSEPHYLLFFGFIRAYKGLDLLLKALADPAMKKRDLRLIVAGEFYEDQQSYLELIDELGLTARVILHDDYIPNEKVKYYFGVADLVVQPYRSATQSGISQLAFHFDRPMVVTRVGGLPEIVDHGSTGYVVDPEPVAIARAIEDFFESDRLANMVEGVRKAKRKFSWQRLVLAIEEVARTK